MATSDQSWQAVLCRTEADPKCKHKQQTSLNQFKLFIRTRGYSTTLRSRRVGLDFEVRGTKWCRVCGGKSPGAGAGTRHDWMWQRNDGQDFLKHKEIKVRQGSQSKPQHCFPQGRVTGLVTSERLSWYFGCWLDDVKTGCKVARSDNDRKHFKMTPQTSILLIY